MLDEFTREWLAIDVSRRRTSEDVVERLSDLFVTRGTPKYIRSDNGPEFTAGRVQNWLDRVAVALLDHRTTPEYQVALRKSGIAHGQAGLSATEQETRAANRKAKFDMYIAKQLAKEWDTGVLTMNNCYHWQFELLQAYRDGSLHERLRQVTSADTMCRTPSLARGSATEQTIH